MRFAGSAIAPVETHWGSLGKGLPEDRRPPANAKRLESKQVTNLTITIHPELEARLQARADAEGLTVAAYLERIARDDEKAERELEGLALEGLSSGESIVADERYWEAKRNRLIEGHHQKTGTR